MYWLKQHGLKLKRQRHAPYLCRECGETDPDKFYKYRKRLCAACDNVRVKQKAADHRQKVIDYLGGECIACGYNRFNCSLDVHHRDPSTKDPGFSNMRYWSWERTTKELENCVLLCKNCHAAVHAGELKIEDADMV